MMGSTLLVMPACFRQSGWVLGAGLAVLCAGISQYTCGVIVGAGREMSDPKAEFADLASVFLGAAGWYAALVASIGVCLGAACAMHGYLSTSLNDLLIDTAEQGQIGTGLVFARPCCTSIMGPKMGVRPDRTFLHCSMMRSPVAL